VSRSITFDTLPKNVIKIIIFAKIIQMIHKRIKMADLIHLNYHILPIINRFGVFLGFGDKTIEQICKEKNINVDFFLEIVNVFLYDDYFPAENLQHFDIQDIVEYLKKSHKYFLDVKLSSIEKKINALIDFCCKENSQKIQLIKNFYLQYKNELIEHINYEDEVIYPYVLWLADNQNKAKQDFSTKPDFKISMYLENHSDIEVKIFDLKNLIIKYLELPKQTELTNEVLFDLFDFEKDIIDHQQIEEKVLVPKALEIEKKIFD